MAKKGQKTRFLGVFGGPYISWYPPTCRRFWGYFAPIRAGTWCRCSMGIWGPLKTGFLGFLGVFGISSILSRGFPKMGFLAILGVLAEFEPQNDLQHLVTFLSVSAVNERMERTDTSMLASIILVSGSRRAKITSWIDEPEPLSSRSRIEHDSIAAIQILRLI